MGIAKGVCKDRSAWGRAVDSPGKKSKKKQEIRRGHKESKEEKLS